MSFLYLYLLHLNYGCTITRNEKNSPNRVFLHEKVIHIYPLQLRTSSHCILRECGERQVITLSFDQLPSC